MSDMGNMRERWKTRRHVGEAKPTQEVFLRSGEFRRNYSGGAARPNARLPGGLTTPWQASWFPLNNPVLMPNAAEVTLEKNFDNNGIATMTGHFDNVVMEEQERSGNVFHEIIRGFFSPLRGYRAPDRANLTGDTNQWSDMLAREPQIAVFQGYGDARVCTFTGIVEDTDNSAKPDVLTLTARDFGKVLTEERCFGYNIDKTMRDPITFASRATPGATRRVRSPTSGQVETRLSAEAIRKKWILVEDVSEVVKVVLIWAGFKEWEVESTGVPLKDKLVFNRATYYIDIIKKIAEMVNYVFYIKPPDDPWTSIGVPVFRNNGALRTTGSVEQVKGSNILTDIQSKFSQEPKAYIIRARGRPIKQPSDPKAPPRGRYLGGEQVRRIMAVYEPPWVRNGRSARILKHTVHYDQLIDNQVDADVAVRFIALAQALKSATGVVEVPALPRIIELDEQLSILDEGTAMSTRIWIASATSTFRTGEEASFVMSVGGAYIDTPDFVEVRQDLMAALTEAGRRVAPPATRRRR